MTGVHVPGTGWPVRCLGAWGGVRVAESLETDPQAPAWRMVTDWCPRPRRERARHGVRVITAAEVLDACPELPGRLW